MKIPTTANSNAREYVLSCQPFNGAKNSNSVNGHSISGVRIGHLYVVWSYGHWPMFVCDTRTDTWFVNADKYSRTTTKQQGQCRPHGKNLASLPANELTRMVSIARDAA